MGCQFVCMCIMLISTDHLRPQSHARTAQLVSKTLRASPSKHREGDVAHFFLFHFPSLKNLFFSGDFHAQSAQSTSSLHV